MEETAKVQNIGVPYNYKFKGNKAMLINVNGI